MNNVNVKGIFRYVTFGLRSDWVKFFFESNEVSLTNLGLGPKQILALYYYLKDAELIFDRNNFSSFYHYLIDIYKNEGINSKVLWSFLWVNLSFNSPMFIWWNNVEKGKYSREGTINLLCDAIGKRNRAVDGVFTSLAGTFENTPIGSGFKIAIVRKEGRSRTLSKQGGYNFDVRVILYALFKYAEQNKSFTIDLNTISQSLISPQKIFVLNTDTITHSLLSFFEPDFFSIDFNAKEKTIILNKNKKAIDVLDLF